MRGAIAACVAFSAGAAAAIIFYKRSAIKRLAKKAGRPAAKGASDKHFAGRYALGKNMPVLHKKNGFKLEREDGAIRLLGGACGECLGGANLAELLAEGFEIESRAMEALAQNKPAETLSVHTSAGVPTQLDEFIAALKRHLPMADGDDWCVNLQSEGASAVHAAVDMCLQAFHSGELNVPGGRCKLACGASSYHGPASTSPGGATPLGAAAKGLTHPVRYPVPTPFLRHKGESVDKFHARLLSEFGQYLDTYANEIGVLLVEPQWGSSVAAMPWPPKLLKAYIAAAKERGIAVVCDEVMCGLGRHGAEPNGGTGCFLSECWDLQPDCVTFGKVRASTAAHTPPPAVAPPAALPPRRARPQPTPPPLPPGDRRRRGPPALGRDPPPLGVEAQGDAARHRPPVAHLLRLVGARPRQRHRPPRGAAVVAAVGPRDRRGDQADGRQDQRPERPVQGVHDGARPGRDVGRDVHALRPEGAREGEPRLQEALPRQGAAAVLRPRRRLHAHAAVR